MVRSTAARQEELGIKGSKSQQGGVADPGIAREKQATSVFFRVLIRVMFSVRVRVMFRVVWKEIKRRVLLSVGLYKGSRR